MNFIVWRDVYFVSARAPPLSNADGVAFGISVHHTVFIHILPQLHQVTPERARADALALGLDVGSDRKIAQGEMTPRFLQLLVSAQHVRDSEHVPRELCRARYARVRAVGQIVRVTDRRNHPALTAEHPGLQAQERRLTAPTVEQIRVPAIGQEPIPIRDESGVAELRDAERFHTRLVVYQVLVPKTALPVCLAAVHVEHLRSFSNATRER